MTIHGPAELGRGAPISRRALLLSFAAWGVALPRSVRGQRPLEDPRHVSLPVRVQTINHVSFGCDDIQQTVAWFEKVLGIPRHAFQDYGGGGFGQIVLRASIDPPAYMALTQKSAANIGVPSTGRPHFCFGTPDFNVHSILAALAEMRAPAQSVLREGTTINGVNFDGPDGSPLQFNPVIACGGVGFLGEVCDTSAAPVQRPGDPPPIQVMTMNHIKYWVTDLDSALEWFLKLTDMQVVAYQERDGGPRTPGYVGRPIPVLRIGSGPQHLALVEGSGPERHRMHVGFGVRDFDPDRIVARLEEHGVTAQVRMREGVTPEILVDGPDNVRIQLQDVTYAGGGGPLGTIL